MIIPIIFPTPSTKKIKLNTGCSVKSLSKLKFSINFELFSLFFIMSDCWLVKGIEINGSKSINIIIVNKIHINKNIKVNLYLNFSNFIFWQIIINIYEIAVIANITVSLAIYNNINDVIKNTIILKRDFLLFKFIHKDDKVTIYKNDAKRFRFKYIFGSIGYCPLLVITFKFNVIDNILKK